MCSAKPYDTERKIDGVVADRHNFVLDLQIYINICTEIDVFLKHRHESVLPPLVLSMRFSAVALSSFLVLILAAVFSCLRSRVVTRFSACSELYLTKFKLYNLSETSEYKNQISDC